MTDTVVISLERFGEKAAEIAKALDCDFELYDNGVFERSFGKYKNIVALMSAGIAVRGIAPFLNDKWTDPSVVVVSPGFDYAIPVLGGHHGGNNIAKRLECLLGFNPVITTATETHGLPSVEGIAEKKNLEILNKDSTRKVNSAILDNEIPFFEITGPAMVAVTPRVSVLMEKGEYIVGIGCRKGVLKEEITGAVMLAFSEVGICEDDVFVYSTTRIKRNEPGLLEAINDLDGNLVFVDDDSINREKPVSASRASDKLGLSGVAESSALALSRRKEIIMKKHVYGRVTVAIVR
ncbi:cobalt-precorrin 5A hydrolase [Methanoplanus sp. FWC-SCC4]|uniref:Cobalt-precorrin 5A hydrolase n=1 Tax=Methanochimaera problematica TaxID=2609417 RepID=A0AA97FAF4_9EURY|nr:cobalt-precorrin 5A hydrolase [Methanoplanus sp. FWC-SCC4]WOF15830.1 cobalt-precorrin 5A hydrolase [Methanoplanus sp. FWC-SCC4]